MVIPSGILELAYAFWLDFDREPLLAGGSFADVDLGRAIYAPFWQGCQIDTGRVRVVFYSSFTLYDMSRTGSR